MTALRYLTIIALLAIVLTAPAWGPVIDALGMEPGQIECQ